MSVYRLSVSMISRGGSSGRVRSAVASAAYRAGERLDDARLGRAHDYSRRAGVDHAELMHPGDVPEWVRQQDRATFWNTVEASEKRVDAQLARDFEIAIPEELTRDQARAAIRDFTQRELCSRGMVADVSIHSHGSPVTEGQRGWERIEQLRQAGVPTWTREQYDRMDTAARWRPHIVDEGSGRYRAFQPHSHIMASTRTLEADGWGQKNRAWNDKKLVPAWRKSWEDIGNRHLVAAGHEPTLDCRSNEERGVGEPAAPQIGGAYQAERHRGVTTDAGQALDEVRTERQEIMQARREVQAAAANVVSIEAEREREDRLERIREQSRKAQEQAQRPPTGEIRPISRTAEIHAERQVLDGKIATAEGRVREIDAEIGMTKRQVGMVGPDGKEQDRATAEAAARNAAIEARQHSLIQKYGVRIFGAGEVAAAAQKRADTWKNQGFLKRAWTWKEGKQLRDVAERAAGNVCALEAERDQKIATAGNSKTVKNQMARWSKDWKNASRDLAELRDERRQLTGEVRDLRRERQALYNQASPDDQQRLDRLDGDRAPDGRPRQQQARQGGRDDQTQRQQQEQQQRQQQDQQRDQMRQVREQLEQQRRAYEMRQAAEHAQQAASAAVGAPTPGMAMKPGGM